MSKEYPNREFCRAMSCGKQGRLDDPQVTDEQKANVQRDCDRCTAYRFEQYLKQQGYKISKEE